MRACQRCGDLADRCVCPRFAGERHMGCKVCGALWGAHLCDFARGDERGVCPPTVPAADVVRIIHATLREVRS